MTLSPRNKIKTIDSNSRFKTLVLGSEYCENGLFCCTRHFHSYVLVSQLDFAVEEWMYSVTACEQEYLAKYCDLIIQETSLEAHIRDVINTFVRTDSANKMKSSCGRSSVSEEVVDDLRRLENPQISLTKFPQ